MKSVFLEKLAASQNECVILLKVLQANGKHLFFYIKTSNLHYRKLCDIYRKRGNIDPSAIGSVLCFGENEPSAAQMQFIKGMVSET